MSEPRTRRAVLSVVGFLLASGTVWAGGQELQEGFREAVEVTEVLLDVLVTDRQGQVVMGLGADDFEITENGLPIKPTGVTFYSSREPQGSQETLERHGMRIAEGVEDRYFIVLFQQQRRASGAIPGVMARQLEAARDIEAWIADDLQPQDHVAILSYETRLELVQDFSRNLEALRKAVRAVVTGAGGSSQWPSRTPQDDSGPSLRRRMPQGKELRRRTGDIYRALQVLAEAAGSVRGRKNLVFVGRGIGEVESFGLWQPDSRFWEPTIEALNDNNVAVYPLDLMPLGSQHSLEPSMSLLAMETGGTFTRQFTSFLARLREISHENGGYYLLSYPSRREPGSAGYQRVQVAVRDPHLRVRARQGYRFGS